MSNRRQARARAQSRSAHHHKEQSVNTQASQGPTEETPATPVQPTAAATQPAEFPRNPDEQAPAGVEVVGKTEHKGARNPDVERSPQAGSLRRRGYENDVDVTAQGTGRIISLPVYGKLAQLPKSVSDLEYAWASLFNEHENGTKLVADLRSLVIPESELDILMYEARRRGDTEARHVRLYLVVAYDKKDAKYPNAVPVAQYLISTKLISDGVIKSPSPVMATSIYKFGQNEDVSTKYSLHEGEEVNEVHLDQVTHHEHGDQPSVRRIVTPTGWLSLAELAQRWKTIFNEDMFGEVVVGRLGDLEKRQGPLSIRIIPAMPHEYLIMVYRSADLPSFVYAGDQVIMNNGREVVPHETIHLQATIVEGVEVVSRLKVSDEFVSPRYTPKQSAEQIAAESRKAAVVGLHPTDLRTFDAIAFQQFVDQVRQANLAIGDAARLVAFMEFIAKCQQIEKTLFFHCTAYGLQLETMITAGKRHFPGAAEPTAGSLFSAPPRWGGRTQAQQNPTTQSYVQPNQTASDVVISVYGGAGPLLGVFQCAVPPVGYTVG